MKNFFKNKKNRFRIVVAVIILLITGLVGFGVRQYFATRVCYEGSLTYEAITAAQLTYDYESAKALESKITKDWFYSKHADCLAGLVITSLTKGDTEAAESHYKKLEQLASQDTKLANTYKPLGVEKLSDLKELIKVTKEKIKDERESILLF